MADLSEIKTLLNEQGTHWNEYKRTNDERLSNIEKGLSTAAHDEKLAKLEERLGAIDEIKSKLVDFERANARANLGEGAQEGADKRDETKTFNDLRRGTSRPGSPVTDASVDEYVAYRSAFGRFVRYGEAYLNKDEQKAMQAGVDPDGGFLLPPPTIGRIVSKVYELTPIRGMVNVVNISGNDIEGIEDLGEAGNGGWVSETASRTETTTPGVGKWRIEAHEMFAQPRITQRILDDTAFDLETWLANKVASKYARTEADAFCNGNGNGKPRGLFAYTTAATADATRAWGSFEHVVTGANGAFHTTKADPLFDLIAAFKPVYLNRAQWLMNRGAMNLVRKLKEATTDQYLWQPGLQAGAPDMLLGYRAVLSQDVPAVASGSLSMALGDFSEAYTIVDRLGIRTLRDPYTDKPYIRFYSTRRVGGGALNFEAVKFIKFST